MYSLYLCVHCFSVYRYVYSCACSFCALATLRRGALCSLHTFAACFHHCSRFIIAAASITFAASRFTLCPYLYRRPRVFCRTFGRTFVLKRLQRSFHTVFRAVLSVHLCVAYTCIVCPISCAHVALFAANLPF